MKENISLTYFRIGKSAGCEVPFQLITDAVFLFYFYETTHN